MGGDGFRQWQGGWLVAEGKYSDSTGLCDGGGVL